MGDITQLLDDVRAGKPGAQDALFKRVYDELHGLARARLSNSGPLTLLDSSALVQETCLRLTNNGQFPVANTALFFGFASNVMRNVIVDYVRARNTAKRGQGMMKVTLATRNVDQAMRAPDVEALDDALKALDQIDERCRKVVEMRFYGGMSTEEIAVALDVSVATVERDWRKARGFLFKMLKDQST